MELAKEEPTEEVLGNLSSTFARTAIDDAIVSLTSLSQMTKKIRARWLVRKKQSLLRAAGNL